MPCIQPPFKITLFAFLCDLAALVALTVEYAARLTCRNRRRAQCNQASQSALSELDSRVTGPSKAAPIGAVQ